MKLSWKWRGRKEDKKEGEGWKGEREKIGKAEKKREREPEKKWEDKRK